jgi:hypothetical protein
MAIIEFKSSNFFKAFLLYSFIAALASSLAVHIRLEIDNNKYGIKDWLKKTLNLTKSEDIDDLGSKYRFIVAFLITFIITIIIYHIMYFLFGWGSGLLANICISNNKKYCLLKRDINYL